MAEALEGWTVASEQDAGDMHLTVYSREARYRVSVSCGERELHEEFASAEETRFGVGAEDSAKIQEVAEALALRLEAA